jgi:ATP-binding cassette subfamily E protein 1
MFDEPSSYLDVKQRLNAARMIRKLLDNDTYVIAVEHDLSVLDYLSDFICCLYGVPSVYGVVTVPSPVRDGESGGQHAEHGRCKKLMLRVPCAGINIFLDGFIPAENMRFRDESLTFKIAETADEIVHRTRKFEYPSMRKTLGNFHLEIEGGEFADSEILVFLGENGTGKTT